MEEMEIFKFYFFQIISTYGEIKCGQTIDFSQNVISKFIAFLKQIDTSTDTVLLNYELLAIMIFTLKFPYNFKYSLLS